jgi:transposase-like protein
MMVQSACQAQSSRAQTTDNLSRPKCPRCRSVQLAAEESRFSASGRIDHLWLCDDCGHQFVTSIRVWRR